MDNNIIRDLLNNYIKKYGTSKAYVGRAIGVSRNTISQFTNNNRDLSVNVLQKIKDFIFNN